VFCAVVGRDGLTDRAWAQIGHCCRCRVWPPVAWSPAGDQRVLVESCAPACHGVPCRNGTVRWRPHARGCGC